MTVNWGLGRFRGPQTIRAISSQVIDPKPQTYRGTTMRSRLEVDFARHLDGLGVGWVYEPAVFGPSGEGYLPDFQLTRAGRRCFLELKPTLPEVPRAMERMQVIWDAYPEALLVVVCAEGSWFFEASRGETWRSFQDRWVHK